MQMENIPSSSIELPLPIDHLKSSMKFFISDGMEEMCRQTMFMDDKGISDATAYIAYTFWRVNNSINIYMTFCRHRDPHHTYSWKYIIQIDCNVYMRGFILIKSIDLFGERRT